MYIRKQFTKILREIADKVDAGNSELNEEQMLKLMSEIAHQPMSKEAAAKYLNMCTSKFDNLIREGWIPKGRKELGFKELRWYKDELDDAIRRFNE